MRVTTRDGSFAETAETEQRARGERARVSGMTMERLRQLKRQGSSKTLPHGAWLMEVAYSTQFRSSQAHIHHGSVHLHGRIANAEWELQRPSTAAKDDRIQSSSIRERNRTESNVPRHFSSHPAGYTCPIFFGISRELRRCLLRLRRITRSCCIYCVTWSDYI